MKRCQPPTAFQAVPSTSIRDVQIKSKWQENEKPPSFLLQEEKEEGTLDWFACKVSSLYASHGYESNRVARLPFPSKEQVDETQYHKPYERKDEAESLLYNVENQRHPDKITHGFQSPIWNGTISFISFMNLKAFFIRLLSRR